MSSVGNPTVLKTISIVTNAALGNAATPMLVAVEAKLNKNHNINTNSKYSIILILI